jgi:hypothetical protein
MRYLVYGIDGELSFNNSCFSCAHYLHGRILTWPSKAQQPNRRFDVVRLSSLSNQEYELNVFPRKTKLKQIPMSISGQVDRDDLSLRKLVALGVTLPRFLLMSRSFNRRTEGDIIGTRMDCTYLSINFHLPHKNLIAAA